MRKIKEVIRLKRDCRLSNRQIAHSLSISGATVHEYLVRFHQAGLPWPLPPTLDDLALEQQLFPSSPPNPTTLDREMPDWPYIHQELKKKGLTLALLWDEYKQQYPKGYQYSYFCEQYRLYAQTLDPPMRQTHKAGEKLFVDYAGQTVPITDPQTGEIRPAQIFVAALGASHYLYVEASWTQSLQDWIGAHCRAFEFFGGVPEVVVPDNLRAGVSKACRYEPDLNPTYHEMAQHYGVAILPARVRKPKDKAKVENAVLIIERSLLAPLRNRQFFSLAELNQAIQIHLAPLNRKPFQKREGSRQSLFEQLEKPVLRPLPPLRYSLGYWKKAKVHLDYHVEFERHFYSVPFHLVGQEVELRYTALTVEIFQKGQRIASHLRCGAKGQHTTLPEHMPQAHQHYLGYSPEQLHTAAQAIGPHTTQLVQGLLNRYAYPVQGYRACLGLLQLNKTYGPERLEFACQRAVQIQAFSYRSVVSLLKMKSELPIPSSLEPTKPPIVHDNIRGAAYYQAHS